MVSVSAAARARALAALCVTAVLLLLPRGASCVPPSPERWYRLEWFGQRAGWSCETEVPHADGTRTLRVESVLRAKRLGTGISVWSRSTFLPAQRDAHPTLIYAMTQGPGDTLELSCAFGRDSVRVRKRAAGGSRTFARPAGRDLLRPDEEDSLWAAGCAGRTGRLSWSAFVPELDAVLPFRAALEGTDTVRTEAGVFVTGRWKVRCDSVPALESTEWRDASGLLVRSESAAPRLTSILTSREDALSPGAGAEILAGTMVPLTEPLDPGEDYALILYQISVPPGVRTIQPAETQSARLTSTGESFSVIECRRIVPPAEGEPHPAVSPPSEAERARALRPSLLIESEDPAVRAAAASAVGGETDPWRRTLLLERFVARRIRQKDLRVLFASAAATLASGEGDCTEHAVLLAGLARAEGIPARVVAGLVAVGDHMAYHLWTEVDVGAGWTGVDAALDRAPTDARYLPLAASDLADDSIGPLTVGLLDVIGRIRVDVLKYTKATRD